MLKFIKLSLISLLCAAALSACGDEEPQSAAIRAFESKLNEEFGRSLSEFSQGNFNQVDFENFSCDAHKSGVICRSKGANFAVRDDAKMHLNDLVLEQSWIYPKDESVSVSALLEAVPKLVQTKFKISHIDISDGVRNSLSHLANLPIYQRLEQPLALEISTEFKKQPGEINFSAELGAKDGGGAPLARFELGQINAAWVLERLAGCDAQITPTQPSEALSEAILNGCQMGEFSAQNLLESLPQSLRLRLELGELGDEAAAILGEFSGELGEVGREFAASGRLDLQAKFARAASLQSEELLERVELNGRDFTALARQNFGALMLMAAMGALAQ